MTIEFPFGHIRLGIYGAIVVTTLVVYGSILIPVGYGLRVADKVLRT